MKGLRKAKVDKAPSFKKRHSRGAAAVLASIALSIPLTLFSPVAPAHAECSYMNNPGTWPLCEIGMPDLPRYGGGYGRPDLTPKDSAWCKKDKIWSKGYYNGWYLVETYKYDRSFALDYYRRTYQAVWWNNEHVQYEWYYPNERDWPQWIQSQVVFCDA